ncbi:MAG: NAD(P)/FAD-dependent oxidoreductase [Candidatus Paceibacterota bacterium]|jgi:phytoene dehydrogenase-like protein
MNSENKKYDAIVVGGGISGLLSALILSKEGKKVLIIEKNSYLGGNCRTYEIDGYFVDTGPHAITDLVKGPLTFIMKKYFTVIPRFVPFGMYYVRYQNKFQEFPLTLIQLAKFDILSKKDRLLLSGALIDAVANSSLNKNILNQSVYSFIGKYNMSPKSIRFLDAVSYFLSGKSIKETPAWRILGGSGYLDGDTGSATSHLRKFMKIARQDFSSQGYPLGGIQSITSCAINSFNKPNVEIHLAEDVTELITKEGSIYSVRTHKEVYRSDLVIFSGYAKDLPRLCRALPAKFSDQLKKIEQTLSFTLWLGFKKKLPEFAYIGSEIFFDSETPFWAVPSSNYDNTLCPKNKQLVGFTTIFKESSFEKQLKNLKECIFKAIPNAEQNVEFEHVQTIIPEKGAIKVNIEFPSPKVPIKGLYLVGTDADMRSMGITRAAFSVIEAIEIMKKDNAI